MRIWLAKASQAGYEMVLVSSLSFQWIATKKLLINSITRYLRSKNYSRKKPLKWTKDYNSPSQAGSEHHTGLGR